MIHLNDKQWKALQSDKVHGNMEHGETMEHGERDKQSPKIRGSFIRELHRDIDGTFTGIDVKL